MKTTYDKLRAWLDVDRSELVEAEAKLQEAFGTIEDVCNRTGIGYHLDLGNLIGADYVSEVVNIFFNPDNFGILEEGFDSYDAKAEMRAEGISEATIKGILEEFSNLTGHDCLYMQGMDGEPGWSASRVC